MRRFQLLWASAILLFTLFSAHAALPSAKPQLAEKAVLVLHSYTAAWPAYRVTVPAMLAGLATAGVVPGMVHFEYLDLAEHDEPAYRKNLRDALQYKIGKDRFDLIIALHSQSLDFLSREGRDLWPGVPVLSLYAPISQELTVGGRWLGQIPLAIDYHGTLKRALELFPKTRRVYFAGGTGPQERRFPDEARAAFQEWKGKLQFEYLVGLSMEEILSRVAKLPPNSIVIASTIVRDGRGQVFVPAEATKQIAKAANAPVFSFYESMFDDGIVGGSMMSFAENGTYTAKVAIEILDRQAPLAGSPVKFPNPPTVAIFDWPRIEYWKGNHAALPGGSVFLNRPPSLWPQHRATVIGTAAAFLVLIAFVATLILQNRRRRLAEESARESEKQYRDIFEQASMGIYHCTPHGRFLRLNPAFAKMLGYASPAEVIDAVGDLGTQIYRDPESWKVAMEAAPRKAKEWLHTQAVLLRKDGSAMHGELAVRSVFDAEGTVSYFEAYVQDTTERRHAELLLQTRLRLSEIGADGTLDELLQAATDSAEALTGSSIGFFHFVDPDQEKLTLQAWSTNTLTHMCNAVGKGSHYPISEAGVWVECVRERKPVIHNDYANLPNKKGFPPGHARVIRELVVPIVRGDKVTEILGVGNKASDYLHADVETVVEIASLVQDIVERKRTEMALEQHDALLRQTEELSGVGGWDYDLNTRSMRWSEETYRIYELDPNFDPSNIAKDIAFYGPGDQTKIEAAFARAVHHGEPYDLELDFTGAKGTRKKVRTTGRVEKRGGTVVRVYGNIVDITERRKAEEALHQAAEEYRSLTATTTDGFWVIDERAKLLDVNAAYCHMAGYSRAEMLAMPSVAELVVPAQGVNSVSEMMARVVAAGGARYEGQHRRKNGEPFDVEVSVTYVPATRRLFAFIRDISVQKRIEQARLSSQRLESLGTLAGGIAHDFNNIVAAIRGNAELAAEDVPADSPAVASIVEIRKASARAAELVRRIMAFGSPKEPRREPLELKAVIDEVLQLLRSTISAGITLQTEFEEDTPMVLADAAQVHEVLVNLTTNAAHAIGAGGGAIEFSVRSVEIAEGTARSLNLSPGDYVRLTVKDDGCGMDQATRARIFDAFFSTKAKGEGTGLGLSMVHGIMKSHGGAVSVDTAPGAGSSFHLFFPKAAGDRAQISRKDSLPFALEAQGLRILYVDDEKALVSIVVRTLTRQGFDVSGYTDPRQALADFRYSPNSYDLVVTDLSMPNMSGFDFARQVIALRKDAPILMISGKIGKQELWQAKEIGVREVLLKPDFLEDFRDVVGRLIATKSN